MAGSVQRFLLARRLGLSVALAALVVDQLSKAWALANLGALGHMVIPGFLGVRVAYNPGMSFSLFADATHQFELWGQSIPPEVWLPFKFGAIAVVAIAGFTWWLGTQRGNRWFQVGVGLIIGGAAGNLADRMQHGAVVDWLDLFFFNTPLWVFNGADAAISVGVALVLVDSLFGEYLRGGKNKAKVRS